MKPTAALILFTVCTLCTAKTVDYRLLPAAAAPKECTTPGPFCETCQSLVACVDQGNGVWIKNKLGNCSTPSYCVDGVCTNDYEPFCWGTPDLSFPCPKVGIFPDPFYCNKFHLCVMEGKTLTDHSNDCEAGYKFNIGSDLCDVKLGDDGLCPERDYPVPLCDQVGDTGPITEKPAMYYLCKPRTLKNNVEVLYPYLDLCPGDETYLNYQCDTVRTVFTTPTTANPTTTTTTPGTTETTPPF